MPKTFRIRNIYCVFRDLPENSGFGLNFSPVFIQLVSASSKDSAIARRYPSEFANNFHICKT
jgi:hypothetical protein